MAVDHISTRARPAGAFARVYAVFWLLLATAAIGYLSVLALRPEWAPQLLTAGDRGAQERVVAAEAATSRILAEVGELRQTVTEVQRDVAELKSLPRQSESRIDAAPGAADQTRQDTTPTAEKREDAAAPEKRAEAAPVPAKRAAAAAVTQGNPAKPILINAAPEGERSHEQQIVTGSIAAPAAKPAAIAFGPATVTVSGGGGPVALQLGSAPSLDALRLNWAMLSERHRAVLDGLDARYQSSNADGTPTYRLLAGPVANADEAKRLCALLRAKRVACGTGSFSGNAL
jgi:hypothetical protein